MSDSTKIYELNVSAIVNNIDGKVINIFDYYIHKDSLEGYRFYSEESLEEVPDIIHYLELILTNQIITIEIDREDPQDDIANRQLGLEPVEEAKAVMFDFLMSK